MYQSAFNRLPMHPLDVPTPVRSHYWFSSSFPTWTNTWSDHEKSAHDLRDHVERLITRSVGARMEAIISMPPNHLDKKNTLPPQLRSGMLSQYVVHRVEVLMDISELHHGYWEKVLKVWNGKVNNKWVLDYINEHGYTLDLLKCMLEHAKNISRELNITSPLAPIIPSSAQ